MPGPGNPDLRLQDLRSSLGATTTLLAFASTRLTVASSCLCAAPRGRGHRSLVAHARNAAQHFAREVAGAIRVVEPLRTEKAVGDLAAFGATRQRLSRVHVAPVELAGARLQ